MCLGVLMNSQIFFCYIYIYNQKIMTMDRITKYYGCKNSKTAIVKIVSLTYDPNQWDTKFTAYFSDWYKAIDVFFNWNFRGHNSIVIIYMKNSNGKFVKTWGRTQNKMFV